MSKPFWVLSPWHHHSAAMVEEETTTACRAEQYWGGASLSPFPTPLHHFSHWVKHSYGWYFSCRIFPLINSWLKLSSWRLWASSPELAKAVHGHRSQRSYIYYMSTAHLAIPTFPDTPRSQQTLQLPLQEQTELKQDQRHLQRWAFVVGLTIQVGCALLHLGKLAGQLVFCWKLHLTPWKHHVEMCSCQRTTFVSLVTLSSLLKCRRRHFI